MFIRFKVLLYRLVSVVENSHWNLEHITYFHIQEMTMKLKMEIGNVKIKQVDHRE